MAVLAHGRAYQTWAIPNGRHPTPKNAKDLILKWSSFHIDLQQGWEISRRRPSALQKLLGSLRPWWHPMGGNGKQTQKPCLSLALLLIMPKGQNDQPPNGWFDGLIMFDSQNQPIVRVHWHSFVPHAHHLLWSNHQSLGKLSKEKTLPSNALAGNSWGSRKSVTTFTCRRSKDLMPRVPAWSLV